MRTSASCRRAHTQVSTEELDRVRGPWKASPCRSETLRGDPRGCPEQPGISAKDDDANWAESCRTRVSDIRKFACGRRSRQNPESAGMDRNQGDQLPRTHGDRPGSTRRPVSSRSVTPRARGSTRPEAGAKQAAEAPRARGEQPSDGLEVQRGPATTPRARGSTTGSTPEIASAPRTRGDRPGRLVRGRTESLKRFPRIYGDRPPPRGQKWQTSLAKRGSTPRANRAARHRRTTLTPTTTGIKRCGS